MKLILGICILFLSTSALADPPTLLELALGAIDNHWKAVAPSLKELPVKLREIVTQERPDRFAKKLGLYTIKHTDGNIMPILEQLVECRPHAIHSLDPMARVDIKEVKKLVGDKVCLCGNVNCALMQTGTDLEVVESAEYCLTHAKPGGGYIFCTSNVPFKGLQPERYRLILDVWKRMREY